MRIEIEEILKKHGCLFMKDDYKTLFDDIDAFYTDESKVNNSVLDGVISNELQRYFELIDKRNKIAEEHPLMRMHDFLRMYEVEEIDKEIKSLNISCL